MLMIDIEKTLALEISPKATQDLMGWHMKMDYIQSNPTVGFATHLPRSTIFFQHMVILLSNRKCEKQKVHQD